VPRQRGESSRRPVRALERLGVSVARHRQSVAGPVPAQRVVMTSPLKVR
jgi:hypothetical protein